MCRLNVLTARHLVLSLYLCRRQIFFPPSIICPHPLTLPVYFLERVDERETLNQASPCIHPTITSLPFRSSNFPQKSRTVTEVFASSRQRPPTPHRRPSGLRPLAASRARHEGGTGCQNQWGKLVAREGGKSRRFRAVRSLGPAGCTGPVRRYLLPRGNEIAVCCDIWVWIRSTAVLYDMFGP